MWVVGITVDRQNKPDNKQVVANAHLHPFFVPTRVHIPNGISIGSDVLCRDHARDSLTDTLLRL